MHSFTSLELSRRHLAALWRETRISYPREACALVFGDGSRPEAVAREIRAVPNAAAGLDAFAVRRVDIERASREVGAPLLGLYHSHRRVASPSARDIQAMHRRPLIWIIGSSGDPPGSNAFGVRAFTSHDGLIVEIELKEVDDDGPADARAAAGER